MASHSYGCVSPTANISHEVERQLAAAAAAFAAADANSWRWFTAQASLVREGSSKLFNDSTASKLHSLVSSLASSDSQVRFQTDLQLCKHTRSSAVSFCKLILTFKDILCSFTHFKPLSTACAMPHRWSLRNLSCSIRRTFAIKRKAPTFKRSPELPGSVQVRRRNQL